MGAYNFGIFHTGSGRENPLPHKALLKFTEGPKTEAPKQPQMGPLFGRNINQIAKRVNAGGPSYQADMEEIRERLDQI